MEATASRYAKFQLIRMVRGAGLLKVADSCRYVYRRLKAWPANRRFRSEHPDYVTPPPHLAFDALANLSWAHYRGTGLKHAGLFARIIRDDAPKAATPLRVLEWGCGPGRLVRHLPALLPDVPIELTGTDYNPESIAWCRANVPGVHFIENGLNPPLALPDASFDVVYCFSVLTHLSEAVQVAWVEELKRVLRPGGMLICTTHGDPYRYLLAAQHEQRTYDAGRIVVQGRYQEGKKWFVSIHPPAWVRGTLLGGWEDVRKVPPLAEEGMLQDVWTARKPATSAAAVPVRATPAPPPPGEAKPPRFSVIMNVYNGEQYLREALASLFAQTFTDWELIFWDDRSTDGSRQVLESFPPDPRVRVFTAAERVPLTLARKAAIEHARGEWLAFIDQDDIWTADKLEKQARVIDERASPRLGIVYGRAMRFGDTNLVRDFDSHYEFRDLPQGDIFEELFLSSCYICQSASCLRTDYVRALEDIPPEFECCSDYYLYTQLAHGYEAACTQDIVCWYRVHGDAMTNRYYTRVLRETLLILERWQAHIQPAAYARLHRVHSSELGKGEITSLEDPMGGARRILDEGSILYLLMQPFSRVRRLVRRAVRYSRHGVAKRPRYT